MYKFMLKKYTLYIKVFFISTKKSDRFTIYIKKRRKILKKKFIQDKHKSQQVVVFCSENI
jgi:hypothetical protein